MAKFSVVTSAFFGMSALLMVSTMRAQAVECDSDDNAKSCYRNLKWAPPTPESYHGMPGYVGQLANGRHFTLVYRNIFHIYDFNLYSNDGQLLVKIPNVNFEYYCNHVKLLTFAELPDNRIRFNLDVSGAFSSIDLDLNTRSQTHADDGEKLAGFQWTTYVKKDDTFIGPTNQYHCYNSNLSEMAQFDRFGRIVREFTNVKFVLPLDEDCDTLTMATVNDDVLTLHSTLGHTYSFRLYTFEPVIK